jgi:sugar O-acyltransferase (sialic acid O-acetyltransferase NeuD family)
MEKVFGLFGTSGFAREVMPFVQDSPFFANDRDDCKLYFVTHNDDQSRSLDAFPVVTDREFSQMEGDKYFNVAIGDPATRRRIANEALGFAKPVDLIDRTVRFVGSNKIAEGAIFCSFSMVTAGATIGRFFQGNIYSYVAHDCVIGNFVTFAPGAKCNGNVIIGDNAYIGAGAIIRNGATGKPLKIGERATIGMGAVVTKDVAPGAVVVGNPARQLPQPAL